MLVGLSTSAEGKYDNYRCIGTMMVLLLISGRIELHKSGLRGSGLSAAKMLRPARCSDAAISSSDRVAEILTILVIR